MRAVVKRTLKLLNDALHMVERMPRTVYVILRDKDDPCLRQIRELRAFCQLPRIHHTTVVARPARRCAFICTLHLTVVELSLDVLCQHIKAHAAPIEIICTLLRDNVFDNEIVSTEEDTQKELHALDIVIKAHVEKGIINQTEFLNQYTIFRSNVLLEHSH